VSQELRATPAEVEDALTHPLLFERLGQRADLGGPRLLDRVEDGDLVRMSVRYRFHGRLAPGLRRAMDPDLLTWVEHATLDRSAHTQVVEVKPDHYGSRLRCRATAVIEANGEGTLRLADVDLEVVVAIVGPAIERAIAGSLVATAGAQARAIEDWITERRSRQAGRGGGQLRAPRPSQVETARS